jgi:type II secretory pathway pseudopilin PulG
MLVDGRIRHSMPGITLIELLIALALSLLLMAAVVQLFDLMGRSLRNGRATIELAGNLRHAANLLQQDRDGATALTLPWIDAESASGYFEVIEGPQNDATSLLNPSPNHADLGTALGDIDDVLQFTARSRGEPFRIPIRGRLVPQPDGTTKWERFPNLQLIKTAAESPFAEVRWWVQPTNPGKNGQRMIGEQYVLMRRVVLVRPDINLLLQGPSHAGSLATDDDISTEFHLVPGDPTGHRLAASLGDLSLRRNRYAHEFGTGGRPGSSLKELMRDYPYPPMWTPLHLQPRQQAENEVTDAAEEYFVLGDVLSFDVRVFDPYAPLDVSGPVALAPGDPGYRVPDTPVARGAFVDLNYARDGSTVSSGASIFSGPPHPKSRLFSYGHGPPAAIWDTWPTEYERDGYDQDGDGLVDEGTNGIDDDNINGVDDPGERETSPPYPVPLRGIEVRIRVMEYSTRQVRQVSVVADLSPE